MKKILTSVVILLFMLILSGFVFAQSNEACIEQVGSGNEAYQIQKGSYNGNFSPENFPVTLIDPDPPVVIVPPVPPDAFIFHSLDHYGAYIKQLGNNNKAEQKQFGKYNRNYILQVGDNHFAMVHQTGDNLVHSLKQYGHGCGWTMFQDVGTPILIITQTKK